MTRQEHSQIRFYSYYAIGTVLALVLFVIPPSWITISYPEPNWTIDFGEIELENYATPTPSPLPTPPPRPTDTPTPEVKESPTPTPTPSPTPQPTDTPTPTPIPTIEIKIELDEPPTPLPKKEREERELDRPEREENLNVNIDEEKLDIDMKQREREKDLKVRDRPTQNTVLDVVDDPPNDIFLPTDRASKNVKRDRHTERTTSLINDLTAGAESNDLGGVSTRGGRRGGGGLMTGAEGGPNRGSGEVIEDITGGGAPKKVNLATLRGSAASASVEAGRYQKALAEFRRMNIRRDGSTCNCSSVPNCQSVTLASPISIRLKTGVILEVVQSGNSFTIFALLPSGMSPSSLGSKADLAETAVASVRACI